MATALLLPCLAANGASWACCAANAACSLCCSLASCFGCKYNSKLAKMTYLFIYLFSAVFAVVLRYWGKEILGNVVSMASSSISNFCANDSCWGMQGAYRVSFSVAVFFATLMPFAWLAPITHLGGWLVKVLLYVLILGLSFLIHNDAMLQYAEVARGFSVIFLLAQVLIIIDFCYNMHEFIVRKMDSTDESLTSQGYVVGICSNGWRNIYITISMILILGSLAALGALYYYLGNCPLHNFFISETLIIGVVFTLVSMMNIIGKGLLPPAIMFAYNTYLVYGAMTNNPDSKCNPELAMLTSNEAAIYSGLVITVLSVTWMAYSSANSMPGAVRMDGQPHSVDNPAVTAGTPVQEWTGKSKTNGHGADEKSPVGTAAAYQADDDEESGKSSRSPALPSSSAAGRHPADDTEASLAAEKPWIFHLVMCLAGMYLAMMVTNWSTPDAATASAAAAGNPEVSAASMWARIGSQWAIHVIYLWTMMAPTCCPGRDFSQ